MWSQLMTMESFQQTSILVSVITFMLVISYIAYQLQFNFNSQNSQKYRRVYNDQSHAKFKPWPLTLQLNASKEQNIGINIINDEIDNHVYAQESDAILFEKFKQIRLDFIKRLESNQLSIFYTFLKFSDSNDSHPVYDAFYRYKYTQQGLGHAVFDENFDLINNTELSYTTGTNGYLPGEDPRSFTCNKSAFVIDNYWDRVKLLHIVKHDNSTIELVKLYSIPKKGKNFSFFCYNNEIYFASLLDPLTLNKVTFQANMEQIDITLVYSDATEQQKISSKHDKSQKRKLRRLGWIKVQANDLTFRGGAAGIQLGNSDYILGFGHRTIYYDTTVTHRPYLWMLDMNSKQLYVKTMTNGLPNPSNYIIDPSCILFDVKMKRWILFTAETVHPWFENQQYYNNMYKIQNMESLLQMQ